MARNAADLLVECLEAEGVRRIDGVPGEENLDLLEALPTSSIELIVTRHEQAAGFMAAAVPARVREAFRIAEQESPGAVHLELPEDIAREDADRLHPIAASRSRRPVAAAKAIDRAVEAIRQAHRPLLMCGAGANRKRTAKMLKRFIDRTGIPFFTTQMGKGVVGEPNDCWMSTAALSDGDYVRRLIDRSGCIINVGHDVVEKPPFFMREGERTVIHVNFFPAQVDPVHFPQLEVVGDIANAIWQLGERLEPQPHWDFEPVRRVRRALFEELDSGRALDAFPIHPRRLVHAVRDALPDDRIVSLDNGLRGGWAWKLGVQFPQFPECPVSAFNFRSVFWPGSLFRTSDPLLRFYRLQRPRTVTSG